MYNSIKKLSDYEISKYELEYGVKIDQKNNDTFFRGNQKNIEKVKAIVKRETFLENNPIEKSASKEGSLSSQLHDLNYSPSYSSMYSSTRSDEDLFRVREFRFY